MPQRVAQSGCVRTAQFVPAQKGFFSGCDAELGRRRSCHLVCHSRSWRRSRGCFAHKHRRIRIRISSSSRSRSRSSGNGSVNIGGGGSSSIENAAKPSFTLCVPAFCHCFSICLTLKLSVLFRFSKFSPLSRECRERCGENFAEFFLLF